MKKIAAFAASLVLLAGSVGFAGAQPRNDPRFDPGRPGTPGDHRDSSGDHSDWRKGVRMSREDWQRGRHLDYREYRLRQPPRGYEWREIDGRFVLGVIATGLIADIIINPGAPGGYRDARVDHSDWRKGVRMSHEDWQRGRHLDYREYHLRRPPRGYEWREIDGRFVLCAIATGLIADIIINVH